MRFLKLSFSLQLAFLILALDGWCGPKVQKSFFDYFRVGHVSFGTQGELRRGNDIYDKDGHLGMVLRFKKQKGEEQLHQFQVVGVFNGAKRELPLEEVAIPLFKETRDNLYLYGDSRKWSHLGTFANGDLLITSPSLNPFDRSADSVKRVPREGITSVPNFGYSVTFDDGSGERSGHLATVLTKDQIQVVVAGQLYTVNRRDVKAFDGIPVEECVVANTRVGFFEREILGFSFEKADVGVLCAVFSGTEPLPLENIAFISGERPAGVAKGQRIEDAEFGLGEIQGWYRDGHVLVAFDSGEYKKMLWNRKMVITSTAEAAPAPDSIPTVAPISLDSVEVIKR